jgi:hypothetical protein
MLDLIGRLERLHAEGKLTSIRVEETKFQEACQGRIFTRIVRHFVQDGIIIPAVRVSELLESLEREEGAGRSFLTRLAVV